MVLPQVWNGIRGCRTPARRALRSLGVLPLLLGLLIVLQGGVHAEPVGQEAGERAKIVYVLTFEGAVTPVLEQYITRTVDTALESGAEAIILQLDTPGGSVNVTKSITQEMLASPVPIVVYVSPAGANAGSAGTFVTLAGHAAAMAPGTSIGAASPVDASGADVGETMQEKVENILSADVENLASRRGDEAIEWAIAAVREAKAATAEQALALGVVDFIAVDTADLLDQLDGHEVLINGQPRSLQTGGATQIPVELTPLQQFLNFITDPTVASILLTLGMLGLIVEIRTPGFGIPGIIGIISLLLAFYALGQLDANFAGLALIVVSIALFVAEAFTPTFGLLAAGGMISFVFGAMLLFNTPGLEMPWTAILVLAGGMGGITIWIGSKALSAQRRPTLSGPETLIGQRGRVKASFAAGETGSVYVNGEWWNAEIESGDVHRDDYVEVIDRRGYTLIVKQGDADRSME